MGRVRGGCTLPTARIFCGVGFRPPDMVQCPSVIHRMSSVMHILYRESQRGSGRTIQRIAYDISLPIIGVSARSVSRKSECIHSVNGADKNIAEQQRAVRIIDANNATIIINMSTSSARLPHRIARAVRACREKAPTCPTAAHNASTSRTHQYVDRCRLLMQALLNVTNRLSLVLSHRFLSVSATR